jgi:hypothetical protein
METHIRITPWIDPVVERRGHDPRSSYVERFWLGTLGPTATWLVRRLAAGFASDPEGYELDLTATAQELGLSYSRGPDRPAPSPRRSIAASCSDSPINDPTATPSGGYCPTSPDATWNGCPRPCSASTRAG